MDQLALGAISDSKGTQRRQANITPLGDAVRLSVQSQAFEAGGLLMGQTRSHCTDTLRLIAEVSAVILPPVASMPRATIAPSKNAIPIISPINTTV
jgi:hypothetical protein